MVLLIAREKSGTPEKRALAMKPMRNVITLLSLVLGIASLGYGAEVTGTVKGPDGAPFMGAFVQARNAKSKITVNVLSRKDGQYRIPNLPAGEYDLRIRAVGYQAQPHTGVTLTADQSVSFEFVLQNGKVHWTDLSLYQADQLLPEGKGKGALFTPKPGQPTAACAACHGIQTRMASTVRDEAGWRDRVEYMRTTMRARISEQEADDIASYLNSVFGEDSTLPKSPAEVAGYEKVVPSFAGDAMNIVYVEYEVGGKFPWSAVPDKNGNVWIPYNGPVNKIARLDPKTGKLDDFPVSSPDVLRIHSAVPAADGTVWFSEQFKNKIGRLDPKTKQISEFQSPSAGGTTHTIRVDSRGMVWSSGTPLSRFDPETNKFTAFQAEAGGFYSIAVDKDDNVWSGGLRDDGKLYRVNAKGELKSWAPPTKGEPRRVQVATDGSVWFGEYFSGKIARFDPKTETFKEYQLPGARPSPYALGFDTTGKIWYASYYMDELGCLDPKTGKVIEYPYPHSENSLREFFPDDQGRLWYGSPSNDRVGYFYLAAQ
jgi:virginiamycin B lyase